MSKVSSFIEYWEKIHNYTNNPDENQMVYFRGQPDKRYDLQPSAFRQNKADEETRIYHEIMIDYPEEFKRREHLSNLAKIQHYGGLSRLLDITTNPLIALYFAVEQEKDADGRVFVFTKDKKDVLHHTSDKALMLSCLPCFTDKEKMKIKQFVDKHKSQITDSDIKFNDTMIRFLHEIRSEFPAFKTAIIGEDLLKSYFVACYKDNERMKIQNGAFIIYGLDTTEHIKVEQNAQTIDISAASKKEILKELRLMGIDSSTVYSDFERRIKMKRLKMNNWVDIE